MRRPTVLLVFLGACAKLGVNAAAATPHSCAIHGHTPSAAAVVPTSSPVLVNRSVYVLSVAGGNVVVLKGKDGLVVVDPRIPEVREALEAFAPGAPRLVINTHSHRDHTDGNTAVAKPPGNITAHRAVKDRLATAQLFKGIPVSAAPASDWPTRTYGDRLTLHLDDEDVELLHPPGAHTDGDSVVIFHAAHVVAMGDVFFPDRFPYVDPDGGGRVDALVHAIDGFVREWPEDTRIVPGHGRPVCSMSDLRTYRDMLHASVAWSSAGRRSGLSPSEVVARGAPTAYKSWSWPLVDEALWMSLVAKAGGS